MNYLIFIKIYGFRNSENKLGVFLILRINLHSKNNANKMNNTTLFQDHFYINTAVILKQYLAFACPEICIFLAF
jgi:hypothetical protein